jgi:diguanylate cyclase (GGDEF)-like protein
LTKILIVDDQEDIRDMTELHITRAGYECLLASNGKEALEVIEENTPEVIILDLMMPVMDGVETCRRVRNSGRFSTTYIIMLSARSETNDKVGSLDVGADAYLTKPFVPDELLAQIRAGLRTVEDRHSAMIDPLTGLYNRRSFDTFLKREKAEHDRYGKDFSLAFLDLDHFKAVNDEYGHDVGDSVLQELADLIRENARPSDLPCRWGGEEFAWLMPQTGLDSAKKAADRLRSAIAEYDFDTAGHLTASLGIALARRDEDLKDLIKRVDNALYLAKDSGRNRVVVEGEKRSDLAPRADIPTSNGQLRMLIADDDRMICEFVCAHAESQGFITEFVTDSAEFSSSYRPDISLIFLDLNMPGVDGVEILRFLAENECKAQVVLISAVDLDVLSAAESMALDNQLQVLGSLQKPLMPERIMSVLDQAKNLTQSNKASTSGIGALAPGGTDELPTLDELRNAIANRELDVYFHPQIKLKGRTLSGVEALARWRHPEKGFIPPEYFVPFAEKYNLIDDLTRLVVEKVCEACREWPNKWDQVPISVNISELNLDNLNFPEEILQIVQKYDIKPSVIMVEVTETSLATDPNHVLNVLTRLRLKGFQLSIDDFGTGHSSLARLRKIPFRELKIDKMFVETCDTDRENQIIVSNTLDLAHSLGLTVVAEGVETEAQLAVLEKLKCDHVQGFYFTKPLPAHEFEAWHEARLNSKI